MLNLFDQFIGTPIDWENILNMPLVMQIGVEYSPEVMASQIRASSIDPNELVTIADLLVSIQFLDHAKVAWEEAIRLPGRACGTGSVRISALGSFSAARQKLWCRTT